MKKLIIGLTGGIGSGKSTVASFFQNKGLELVDADKIAREVVNPGSKALNAIAEHFSTDVLLEDGHLNRAKLREIIFSNEKEKNWLNSLLHPLIRSEILHQLDIATGQYVLLDAALLFENKLNEICDKTIVVDLDIEQQIKRASHRDNVDIKQIKSIISAQMDRDLRKQKADFVIDNSQALTQTKQQVEQLHKMILTTCSS